MKEHPDLSPEARMVAREVKDAIVFYRLFMVCDEQGNEVSPLPNSMNIGWRAESEERLAVVIQETLRKRALVPRGFRYSLYVLAFVLFFVMLLVGLVFLFSRAK